MTARGRTAWLDGRVDRQIGRTRSSGVVGGVTAVVSIGGDTLLLGLLALRASHRPSTSLQVAMLGGTLLVEQAVAGALKRGVGRDRPPRQVRPPVALDPSGPGFPSGHTSSGFFAATALADRSTAPLLYGGAVVVALARLHQGVHRVSDVFAGALLGTAAGAVARALGRGEADHHTGRPLP